MKIRVNFLLLLHKRAQTFINPGHGYYAIYAIIMQHCAILVGKIGSELFAVVIWKNFTFNLFVRKNSGHFRFGPLHIAKQRCLTDSKAQYGNNFN